MTPTIRTNWLNALRSGAYRQTQSSFADSDGFCVLGVLCVANNEPALNSGAGNWLYASTALSKDFRTADRLIAQLWTMNDSGWDFPALANWIEANVPLEEDKAND